MLRITRRLKRIALTIPRRSPSRRVIPALSIATVRAIAHGDADIGSRQRGIVIDAIASHGDDVASAAKFLDLPIFVLGRNFVVDLIDIYLFGNGPGGGMLIAV